MWVFTKHGFYSIVQHNRSADLLLVRARTEGDLLNMKKELEESGVTDLKVEDDPTADYRWRMVVPRFDVQTFLMDEAKDIDYTTSVKDALDQGDHERHLAMLDTWSAMGRLQWGRRATFGSTDVASAVSDDSDVSMADDWDDPVDLLWDLVSVIERYRAGDEGAGDDFNDTLARAKQAIYYDTDNDKETDE